MLLSLRDVAKKLLDALKKHKIIKGDGCVITDHHHHINSVTLQFPENPK